MSNLSDLILYSLFLLLLHGCVCTTEEEKEVPVSPDYVEKHMEGANVLLTMSEEDQIQDYIDRYSLPMNRTGTGLRYYIYKNGSGRKIENNTIVRFNFKVQLLNGYVCYDSKTDGYKEALIGKADVVSGLEEGLKYMREGDSAKLIIPSHLAYGLLGDQDKIPTRATLIYDVEILQVRDRR